MPNHGQRPMHWKGTSGSSDKASGSGAGDDQGHHSIAVASLRSESDQLEKSLVNSRSSAKHLYAVISKFDARKMEMVKSIGFGGLLELPHINKVNRKFTLWLLSKIRWWSCNLVVGDNINLPLVADHVGKIIGIPSTGIDLGISKLENEEDKRNFMKNYLSFLGEEAQILQNADILVQQELPDIMTKEHADKFKVAFVIFTMGRFLAPTTSYTHGNWDFWGALKNADEISCFNWSEYVLEHIIDAARKITWGSAEQKPVSSITGCQLILQIIYLDNVDLMHLNLPHDVLPRVKAFNSEIIAGMVAALTVNGSQEQTFSLNKKQRSGSSCYKIDNQPPRFHSVNMGPPTSIRKSASLNRNGKDYSRRTSVGLVSVPSDGSHGSPQLPVPSDGSDKRYCYCSSKSGIHFVLHKKFRWQGNCQ